MTTKQRNVIGTIGWFAIACVIGVAACIVMYIRERYQYQKYLKPCNIPFEWDDVKRYSCAIILGTGVCILWMLRLFS